MSSIESTPQHLHHPPVTHHHSSAGSTDTDMTTLDTHELWLPDSEPTPSTLSALHQFGAEMLRLSRGLESVGASLSSQGSSPTPIKSRSSFDLREEETAPFEKFAKGTMGNHVSLSPVRATFTSSTLMKRKVGFQKRRATTVYESDLKLSASRKRGKSLRENTLELYKSYDHDSDLSDSGMDEYLTNEDPFESPEKHSRGDCNNIPKNLHSFRREKSQKTASFERIKSENIINQLNSTLMNDAKMIKGALKLDTGGRGTLVPPTRPPTEGLEGILKSETTDISPFSRSRSGSESNLSESPTVKRNSVSLPKKRPIKDKRSYSIHSSDVKFFRDSNKLLGKAFSLKLNRGGGIGSSPPSGIAVDESSGPRRSRRDKNKGKETERKPSLRTIQNALSDSAKDESSSEDGECSSEKEFSSAMEEEAKLGDTGGIALPPPCRCPYFGETGRGKDGGGGATSVGTKSPSHPHLPSPGPIKDSRERKVSSTTAVGRGANHTIVRWGTSKSQDGDSKVRTEILTRGGVVKEVDVALSTNRPRRSSSATKPILRRAATVRNTVSKEKLLLLNKLSADSPGGLHQAPSPILFRCGSTIGPPSSSNVRNHHSRNSSLMTRNSSRHGRIIRLEQKATKVLGVVFFTFVILWAPFFVLNLLPSICSECERNINKGVFDLVTWLGYASSMVNPIFYTIFNKVFRQTFKKVLLCKYHKTETWKPVPKR